MLRAEQAHLHHHLGLPPRDVEPVVQPAVDLRRAALVRDREWMGVGSINQPDAVKRKLAAESVACTTGT